MIFLYILFLNFLFMKSYNLNKKVVSSLIGVSILFPNNLLTQSSESLIPVAQAASYEQSYVQTSNNKVYLYGGLSQQSSKALKDALNEVIEQSLLFESKFKTKSPPIHLHIQSEGGSLLHTLYIVDIIKHSPVPIYTHVDGFAASAATLLSVVGHKRYMSENSLMLIHQLSSGSKGKYNELADDMDNYNTLMDKIKNIYYKHTNIKSVDLEELLKHDLWLDSKKCLEYGLVDEITTD